MKPRRTNAPNPSPAVAAILLGGWGTPPLDREPHHGFGDGFFQLYEDGDVGLARLWRDHEPFLRAEAARLGIAPEWDTADGTPLFFGEYMQHQLEDE